MKVYTLAVVAVLGLVCLAQGAPKPEEDEPAFVRSLNKLYHGPPVLGEGRQNRDTVRTEWIEQKLDQFDDKDTRTWKMRYMVNDANFKEGGAMFIYLGGEWEISENSIKGGHFYDMAKEHNGILYYTEHRYYGRSQPTTDITVENLKYLHVKQALADVAHFIRKQRETNSALAKAKVIMAGGSYSATMVVWFKRMFPDLLDGGWASSAPILAKVNFLEYKEVVGQALKELGSQQCYDRVQKGIFGLEQMFEQNRGAEVKAMLKLCNNFDEHNDLDLWSLFGSISNTYSGLVQYQSGNDVPDYCKRLMSYPDDVTAVASMALQSFGGNSVSCLDMTYKSTLSYYKESSYRYGASRPWYFQTCNEYGWYQSSSSSKQPFGRTFPVALYTTLCYDIFGSHYSNEQINKNAEVTNAEFGGMSPQVERVYQTHGALDPWNPMGHGYADGATVIPRASHCQDLQSISNADSAEMRATKERVSTLVREWLKD